MLQLTTTRSAIGERSLSVDDREDQGARVALEHEDGDEGPAAVVSAEATPTVFYQREGGKLAEVVSVVVRWRSLAPRGSVTLLLRGWSDTQPLTTDREFGEQRLEFLVPEFAAGTRATITLETSNRASQFSQTLNPARKWTVYMVPHEHLDVGYSDFQTKLAEIHSRIIGASPRAGSTRFCSRTGRRS